jgi:hypothetical protein
MNRVLKGVGAIVFGYDSEEEEAEFKFSGLVRLYAVPSPLHKTRHYASQLTSMLDGRHWREYDLDNTCS